MTIVFFSAGLYHHISEVTDALYDTFKDEFHFFALDDFVPESIRIMGHVDNMSHKPYYRNINDSEKTLEEARYWCTEADVGIIGCGNCESYLQLRMTTNKLTFKMKERLFKKGLTKSGVMHYAQEIKENFLNFRDKNLYYLCIGHFSAHDLQCIGISQERLLKWGYFIYPSQERRTTAIKEDGMLKICWAGRFIPQKRPEMALQLVRYMYENGIDVELSYIGCGVMEEQLKRMTEKWGLMNRVHFLGTMPEWQVREVMREQDCFLFTSTGWEGWGVVLSEAMSEGVLCIATKTAGSSMELITDGVNGFLLSEDLEFAKEKCLEIAQMDHRCWEEMGRKAQHTLENLWNGHAATKSLISLLKEYEKTGRLVPRREGICSVASIEPYEEYEDTFFVEDGLREFGIGKLIS